MALQEIASEDPAYAAAALPRAFFPQVSICVVNWNCRQYLRQLLTSLEAAGEDPILEIIVVDNASTDDSACMVEAEFPHVQIIRNKVHEGVARANNRAAARARGALLLFLNNDTVVRPGAIAALVKFLGLHPEVALVAPKVVFPDGRIQGCVRETLHFQALLHRIWLLRWTGIFRHADREYKQIGFDHTRSTYVAQIVGPALLMRREQFFSINGWDEKFEFRMDDVDLSSRLGRLGKTYYLAEAQVIHWGGIATELDRTYAYWNAERSTIHYIRKHFGTAAARSYKILVLTDMPVRIVLLGLAVLAKLLAGRRERSARSYRKLIAAWHLVTKALPAFLKS